MEKTGTTFTKTKEQALNEYLEVLMFRLEEVDEEIYKLSNQRERLETMIYEIKHKLMELNK